MHTEPFRRVAVVQAETQAVHSFTSQQFVAPISEVELQREHFGIGVGVDSCFLPCSTIWRTMCPAECSKWIQCELMSRPLMDDANVG